MQFDLSKWGDPVRDTEDPSTLVYTMNAGTSHARHLYVTISGSDAGQAVERDSSNSVVARGTVPGFHTTSPGGGSDGGGGSSGANDPNHDPKKDPQKPHVGGLSDDQTLPSSFSTDQLKGWGWVQDKSASSGDKSVWIKNGNTLDVSSNGSAVYTNYQAGNGTGISSTTEHVRVTDPDNAGFIMPSLPTPAQQLAALEKGGEHMGIGGHNSSAGFGGNGGDTAQHNPVNEPSAHQTEPAKPHGNTPTGDSPAGGGGGYSPAPTVDVNEPKIKHFSETQTKEVNNGSPAGTDASTSGVGDYQTHVYTAGAPIESVKQLANGATLTTTASGAEIETTAAGNSYRVKAPTAAAPIVNTNHGLVDESSFGMPSAAGAEHTIGRADPSLANVPTTSTTPNPSTPVVTQADQQQFETAQAKSSDMMATSAPAYTPPHDPAPTMAPTTPQAVAAASSGSNEQLSVTPNNLVTLPPVTNETSPPVGLGGLSVDTNAHSACFPAGSLVLTPKGEVPIESIEEGDDVNIWNLHQHKLGKSKVTKRLVHENEPTIIIRTNTSEVTTTPDHRFWTGHDWVPAGKLKEGSTLFDSHGYLREVKEIRPGEAQTVYNLHVKSPEHNYLVEGLLVHNMKMAQ